MEYRKLGNSELKVSAICLGCMGFGDAAKGQHSWTVDEETTRVIIKRALELGVNFFDTAPVYQNGTSEQYIGKALRDYGIREEIIVATKFTPRSAKEITGGVSGREHIRESLHNSLKNLGMDYVDLYIYHMWDYHTPMEEIMEGLHEAVVSGKVKAIGISNCFAWQLAKANDYAKTNGLTQFVSMQGHYNLIAREEEREMISLCTTDNIALTPYSALAGGRLSKRPGETSKRLVEDTYAKGKYNGTAEADNKIIERVEALANKHNVSMTEVSLAWLLTKVTAPIVGATKLTHVEGAVKAVDLKLSDEEIDYLEELYIPHPLVGVMAQNGKQK